MSTETYRDQLSRLVHVMTVANHEDAMANDLAEISAPSRIKMFVDGNLEKRMEKLDSQLGFVADAFDDFEFLIGQYVRQSRLASYDTGTSDGEHMLIWLGESQSLTPDQRDYVTCQRARHAVEGIARKNRLKHVRFQELFTLKDRTIEEVGRDDRLRIYLNPIREWSRFITEVLLDDGAELPADVLFFPLGEEVNTAVMELEGQALLNELADFQPCTINEWFALGQQADRDELIETSRDLAEMGLVAFG
jgi:hypothetical protein